MVYRFYAGLARSMDPEAGLGGKLLYVGKPDDINRRLLRAANIAGAASLAASSDPALLRQAMREGAIDFVVNSLDEALRILKNEIRKRQPVAVGVSIAPDHLLLEAAERGVQPDLLAACLPTHPALEDFCAKGARTVEPWSVAAGSSLRIFLVPESLKPLATLDALLLECLAPGDHVNRRWVRLAPNYLGPSTRRLRSVVCDPAAALELRNYLQTASQSRLKAET